MNVLQYRGSNPIPEIQLQRTVDITSVDFDGTDDAMLAAYKTLESNGSRMNPWKKGFLVQATTTDGTLSALCYEDYKRRGAIDDTLAQTISISTAGYSSVRVIKIYSAGASDTSINIGL